MQRIAVIRAYHGRAGRRCRLDLPRIGRTAAEHQGKQQIADVAVLPAAVIEHSVYQRECEKLIRHGLPPICSLDLPVWGTVHRPQVWDDGRHRCVTRKINRKDHVAVTAYAYNRRMLSAERHGEPGVTGVLILRVWLEDSSGDPQLRIRMTGRQDLAQNAEDTASASTIEETLAYVRDWLERFAMSGP